MDVEEELLDESVVTNTAPEKKHGNLFDFNDVLEMVSLLPLKLVSI